MAKHLFIVGAQRSGTTYLYNVIDAHPAVYMAKPVKPEPKYFMNAENAAAGYAAYHRRYFSGAGDALWLGEKSTSYIERPDAARAIKETVPDATILFILRNPIERALSNYNFTKDFGLEPYDIERAIQEEPLRRDNWQAAGTSVTPYAYIERGKYIQYLDVWENLFGKNRMVLLVAEQFIGNQTAVSSLYERLGIDTGFVSPNLMDRVNEGSAERVKCVLSSQTRASLQSKYRPWNLQLEERYGLDLACWENGS